jgi:hypothetical protein
MRKGAKGEVGKRREAQEKRGGENNEDKVSAKVNIGLCNTSLSLTVGSLAEGEGSHVGNIYAPSVVSPF